MEEKPIIPDYCPPLGVDMLEFLEEYDISQREFAARTELTEETISKIANAAAPITPETARKFAMALGTPASYWINRESQYRQYLHELALREWTAERMLQDAQYKRVGIIKIKRREYSECD